MDESKSTCLHSDSVLCLERMSELSIADQRWENSDRELLGIDGEAIEFDWNISQDSLHWRSSRRPRETCKIETLNLKILKIESSSCLTTMTSNKHREVIQKHVFRILNSQEVCEETLAKTLEIPRPWYGPPSYTPEGKWDSIATQMVERCKRNPSPSIQEHQCFESWNFA